MEENRTSERFVRWQEISRGQLSHAISLIFGLATAALGFETSLLLNEKFAPTECWQNWFFFFSFLLLACSIAVGITAVVTRLCDFRLTARIVRARSNAEKLKKPKSEIKDRSKFKKARRYAKQLGKRTWWLFQLQIGSFAAGSLLLRLSFCRSYWFPNLGDLPKLWIHADFLRSWLAVLTRLGFAFFAGGGIWSERRSARSSRLLVSASL